MMTGGKSNEADNRVAVGTCFIANSLHAKH
jgi:hypothetical protein